MNRRDAIRTTLGGIVGLYTIALQEDGEEIAYFNDQFDLG